MTEETSSVNTIAPLTNVAKCTKTLKSAIDRPAHLPGIVCFYGPSGLGKSNGAAFAAIKFNAYHVECKSTWSQSAFLKNVLKEMGVQSKGTIADMTDDIAEQLALSGRPLIIDEFDYMVKKGIEGLVKDLYEGSNAAILLIGEENLETNLLRNERLHNRILKWEPAQSANFKDADLLRKLYCSDVEVADDILHEVVRVVKGCTRRICVNLYNIQSYAKERGKDKISLSEWGDQSFYTGNAPHRRLA